MNENPNSEIENSAENFRQRKNEKEIESAVEKIAEHLGFPLKKFLPNGIFKENYATISKIENEGAEIRRKKYAEIFLQKIKNKFAAEIENFLKSEKCKITSDEPQFLKREN